MKFSVIIPLYNKAPYAAKAIQSVLTQTFSDYELVIVDDGSKDDSAEIAARAIKGHANCRILKQENTGVSMARNNGVTVSQGENLCFLDADDWWEPTFLEEMNQLVEVFPDAGVYGTSYTIVNENKRKTRVANIGVDEGFESGYINYCQVYAKTMCMPLWTGAVCIPRSVFEEMEGFNPRLKMGEDFDLWIRIVVKYKVAFLNRTLSYYNQDVESRPRAIGSMPAPRYQFAFCADYLKQDMERNDELKYLVECIQIICLRNYYLSKTYHDEAVKVLNKISLTSHISHSYADYLKRPLWQTRLLDKVIQLKNSLRYGQ